MGGSGRGGVGAGGEVAELVVAVAGDAAEWVGDRGGAAESVISGGRVRDKRRTAGRRVIGEGDVDRAAEAIHFGAGHLSPPGVFGFGGLAEGVVAGQGCRPDRSCCSAVLFGLDRRRGLLHEAAQGVVAVGRGEGVGVTGGGVLPRGLTMVSGRLRSS